MAHTEGREAGPGMPGTLQVEHIEAAALSPNHTEGPGQGRVRWSSMVERLQMENMEHMEAVAPSPNHTHTEG